MKTKIYCVGMRVEEFVDEGPSESSYDMEPISNTRYILCCITKSVWNNGYSRSDKMIINLSTSYGWCGSGYCTASWGMCSYSFVDDFGPITHKPKGGNVLINGLICDSKEIKLNDSDWDICDEEEFETNVFSYSNCGLDTYYPDGSVSVNLDLFEELPRAMKKRPVWVFYGTSGLGKSTLGLYLKSNYTIFETDSCENLPAEIWADIVIIGNKWKHTFEDVSNRIAEKDKCEIIPVKFG